MIHCLAKIKKHVEESGLDIPYPTLKQMAEVLAREQAQSLTPAEFRARADELIKEHTQRWAARKRALDAMVIAKSEQVMQKVMDTSDGKHVFQNILNWSNANANKPAWGSNLDVQDIRESIEARLTAEFRQAVKPFVDKVSAGKSDLNTMREMFAIARIEPLGKTGDASALEFAKAVTGTYNSIFNLKKSLNPLLERIPEYIQKGMHDPVKIREMGKSAWIELATRTYGARSFPEASAVELPNILGNIFDRIQAGEYGSVVDDAQADKYAKTVGSNIINRQNQQRKLIPNDADSLYEYNQKAGYGNLFETMEKVIRGASQEIAMMSKFGPNPVATQERVLKQARARATPAEKELIDRNKSAILKSFATVNRQIDVPAKNAYAIATKTALSWQYISKAMHGVVKAQLDIANAAALMRGMNGKNVFQNGAEIATAYYSNMAKILTGQGESVREAVEPMWLMAASAKASLIDELGGAALQRGKMAKVTNFMSIISGHLAHVDAFSNAVGVMMGNHLGKMAGKPYENLPGYFKTWLGRYEVGEGEWNVIRTAVEPWDDHENGVIPAERRKMIDATGMDAIPDEIISDYLMSGRMAKSIANLKPDFKSGASEADIREAASNSVTEPTDEEIFRARKDLSFKVGAMINENARLSVVRPGTKQRALLYQGKDVNDPLGMALRLTMQFKGAAVTQLDTVKRGYYSGEGGRGDWRVPAAHIAMLLFITSMTEILDDLMNGKTPSDPASGDFAMRVAKKSGAAGLYSDIMLGIADSVKHAKSMEDLITEVGDQTLGPTVMDTTRLGLSAVAGAAHAAGADGERLYKSAKRNFGKTVIGLVPGHNLFYGAAAFNYFIANGLREFLNNGYLSHLESGVESRPGLLEPRQRYFMGKPTESPQWKHSLLGQ